MVKTLSIRLEPPQLEDRYRQAGLKRDIGVATVLLGVIAANALLPKDYTAHVAWAS